MTMMGWRDLLSPRPRTSDLTKFLNSSIPSLLLDRIEGLFVEVLLLAREAGVLKLGTVTRRRSAPCTNRR